jgi:hypothetical protein
MAAVRFEFITDDAVTLWENGKAIATGHGLGHDGALLDLWRTLLGSRRDDLAEAVAERYRSLTGHAPRWPRS